MMRKLITILAVAALLVLSQGVCGAEKINKHIETWDEIDLQGKISDLSPSQDYIVVSERRVYLVDLSYGGKRYTTSISDDSGKRMNFTDLKVGKWVSVWGGVLKDKRVGARAIIISSGYYGTKVKDKDFQNLKKYQTWGE
jgi:hypothetical protein